MASNVPLAKLRGAALRKRITQLAANPNTRAALPDKYLTPAQRASRSTARRMKQENATLYNPSAILSGNDLRNAVKSEVNLQLNPQISAYDTNIKSLTDQRDRSTQRISQLFAPYIAASQNTATALSSSGQALADKLAGIANNNQAQLQNIQSGIDKTNAADVALRGAGLQGDNAATQAVNIAKANAIGSAQDQQNLAAAYGQGYSGVAGAAAATAPIRANDAMAAMAGKFNDQLAQLYGKRADVEASRGDLTTQTLNKMRQDQFTNLATMKGLDLKASDLQETVRSNKAQETLAAKTLKVKSNADIRDARTAKEKLLYTKQKDRALLDIKRGIDPITGKKLPKKPQSAADALSAWKLDFAKKHGYLPKTGPGKTGGGSSNTTTVTGDKRATTPQITAAQTGYSAIANAMSNAKGDFPGNRASGGTGAIKALIGEKPTTDPLLASIAADMAYDGHISKRNAEKLHKRGLNVSDLDGVVSYQDWVRKNAGKPNRSNPTGGRKGTKKRPPRVASGAFPPIQLP